MRCFGNSENDRICDLCEHIQPIYFDSCRKVIADRLDKIARLEEIRVNCPYRSEKFQDRETYDICGKLPYPYNQCNPKEYCLKNS